MTCFVHLTGDIHMCIHVRGRARRFCSVGGLFACVFPLCLYLGSDVQLHMFGSDGAYKHSLYLVLYKLSVKIREDWKFDELSCWRMLDSLRFFPLLYISVRSSSGALLIVELKYLVVLYKPCLSD